MPQSPFQGEKVSLRPFEPEDAEALRAYLNHPGLMGQRCIPWGFPELVPLSEMQVQGILERWAGAERGMTLAVEAQVRKQSWALGSEATDVSVLVGHADMDWTWDVHSPSVAVCIAPEHQRKGFGSAALRALVDYLFDYSPAHTVGCWVPEWNEPALGFLQHHGFHVDGRMRRVGMYQGRPFDLIVHNILRSEWKAREGGPDAA